jgi:hypothetical protein
MLSIKAVLIFIGDPLTYLNPIILGGHCTAKASHPCVAAVLPAFAV